MTVVKIPNAVISIGSAELQLHSLLQLPPQSMVLPITAAIIPAKARAALTQKRILSVSAKPIKTARNKTATPIPYSAFAATLHFIPMARQNLQTGSIKVGITEIKTPKTAAAAPVTTLFFISTTPSIDMRIPFNVFCFFSKYD
jgi:hypothetical protein